jgi:hypothetical protein
VIPRIANRPVEARLVRRAHRELVHVRFAEHDDAGAPEPLDHRGVVRRDEVVQHPGAARGLHARRAEDVLVREGDAGQRRRVALREAAVGRRGLGQCLLGGYGNERVQRAVEALDTVEEMACELRRGDAPRP